MAIHPTAVIDETAKLGDVEIGPFAVIGAGVTLADGVSVGPHAVVMGPTSVGEGTRIDAHAVLGGAPQDNQHDASVATRLEIGARNQFREFTTVHRGSSAGRGVTRIGDENYFMSQTHVACDASVGNGVTLSTAATLAGHVDVGDGAVLGVGAAIHQYCRIGRLAMVGQGAMCTQDVPPFTLAQGDRARLFGLNVAGLRREKVQTDAVSALKDAWRVLFTDGLPLRVAMGRVRAQDSVAEVDELLAFLAESKRGIARAVGRR
ncbi:MAG: acyl-ACP--UDP-N-acetylglucosamine O-acyltransferase [Proteobacteria bacterium]|nr:acyl-ACP--UDP-N-acetylglucosamine O-acyltransferase [Pseudomonadota bacterium]